MDCYQTTPTKFLYVFETENGTFCLWKYTEAIIKPVCSSKVLKGLHESPNQICGKLTERIKTIKTINLGSFPGPPPRHTRSSECTYLRCYDGLC